MIANESDFQQTLEQLERVCRVLASLRDQVLPRSGQQFAVMAEGPLDPINLSTRSWNSTAGRC